MAEAQISVSDVVELEAALQEIERMDAESAQAEEDLGSGVGAVISVAPGPGLGQVGAEALGSITGAPPRMQAYKRAVVPAAAVGAGVREPSQIVDAARQSREVTLIAPAVGFGIYVGDTSVQPGVGVQLPPIIPYTFIIPGGMALYAVTDAPVMLQVQVQVAPLLIGDRERAAEKVPLLPYL